MTHLIPLTDNKSKWSTHYYKKNIFLKKRFGLFKSIVYRKIQTKSFTRSIKCYLDLIFTYTGTKKNNKLKKLFEYLYRTKDIWGYLTKFSITVKDKLFDFYKYDPNLSRPYLLLFECLCPYVKRNGQLCLNKCKNGNILCLTHINCKDRLKSSIFSNLSMSSDICNIIFKYSLCY